jgi:hypothetical protein
VRRRESSYPPDLFNRLLSYENSGVSLLFTHYLEHVGSRLHDIEWHRSPYGALSECIEARREISESILGKITDLYLGLKSQEAIVRSQAERIVARDRGTIDRIRFASYFVSHLISRFRRIFCLREMDSDYDKRIESICRLADLEVSDDNDLRILAQSWRAFVASDARSIEQLSGDTSVSRWLGQVLSFAVFVLGLERGENEVKTRHLPTVFLSFHFDAQKAAVPARIVEALPERLARASIPVVTSTGVSQFGADFPDVIRQKLFFADLVVPFIPANSSLEPTSYKWIVKEVEHARLLKKEVVAAVESGASLESVHRCVREVSSNWFSEDARAGEDRGQRVLEVFRDQRWFSFRDVGPNDVDQNLVDALKVKAAKIAGDKACDFLRCYFELLDDPVRRWTAFMLRNTSVRPLDRGEAARLMLKAKLLSSEKDCRREFDRLRDAHGRMRIAFGADLDAFPLVQFDSSSKRYKNNLSRIMKGFGLHELLSGSEQLALRARLLQRADAVAGFTH